ncbi:hypothetical protein F2Q69_00035952 [Brassica cretica]|uniref:Uncharacterized protein n=1 Tax=Brassica cretica TaxID=69181 RepID=A0A8S9SQK4_BRACR|nr:hypothetical protein F2Q69_00035952 [Brassica cretica]
MQLKTVALEHLLRKSLLLKLENLDKKDREIRRKPELKNNLESYVYATKEKLDTPEFEKVSTQEERKTFVEKLDEACIIYLLNSMCKIGFTWTEKMVTNLGEVPLRSKKKIVSDKLYRALYSKILLPYHEFFQGKLNFKASVFLCFHHITLILVHQFAIITLGIWRSHDRTPREIPVASTDEINTVSEEAGGVTAELGVAANANYCINQSDT